MTFYMVRFEYSLEIIQVTLLDAIVNMISYKDGIIYIYILRKNLNLIRFLQNFSVTNYSKHSCRGYGDILGVNNIQSIIFKRVCISKSIFRTINKRCKE